ncbi:type II toxin-antitoxin system HicB family antitoxin [uncultured Bacteroides sp.]|uniref:type II toxin-antitoxin system HicB family antitoxin n=1 Tax=uncultured Bacteroides sp. TaxID=162156 RepID=UPI0025F5298D|nr:type II toxin-antitoxin system HicB family antitoxin [uncultured Bacteroides sp.]
MNTLKYKGYIGTVGYSEEDEVFFGKVEGVNALINFEGESVKELKKAFEEAIDDYLAYCEAEGISPDKSYSGVLNIRISPDIHSRIAALARETGTTINGYIKQALENQLKIAHQ